MMAELSSSDKSVNSGTIVGAVTRMISKAKKPISATVTAPMAASLVGPNVLTNSIRPCTRQTPKWRPQPEDGRNARLGKFCRVDGFNLVNGAQKSDFCRA